MNITLRQAVAADRPFVISTYFEAARWILEELHGWEGDDIESEKFTEFYRQDSTQLILVEGHSAVSPRAILTRVVIALEDVALGERHLPPAEVDHLEHSDDLRNSELHAYCPRPRYYSHVVDG